MTSSRATRETRATATAEENVRVTTYDTAILRYCDPCWDAYPDAAKLHALRESDPPVVAETRTHNTTCVELDELRVEQLNQATADVADASITAIDVGDDDTTPAYSNRSLNSHVATIDVAEYDADPATELTINAVVGSEQANDADGDLVELGAVTGSGHFLNHSTFTGVEKTNNRSVVLEVTLAFTNQ